MRDQDRKAAGSRAQVERRRDLLRRPDVRRETVGEELGDERAGNQHALVDVETELAEPGLVREIRRRHALVDPAREELLKMRAFGLRQPRIEERLEPVERQRECMEQQIRGLVVGVVRAVPEDEFRLAEPRHGVAQPVAQRFEVVRGRRHHREPGNSSCSRIRR